MSAANQFQFSAPEKYAEAVGKYTPEFLHSFCTILRQIRENDVAGLKKQLDEVSPAVIRATTTLDLRGEFGTKTEEELMAFVDFATDPARLA